MLRVSLFTPLRGARTEGVWLYLVLSDDPVGLRRLPPLQDDLLLVGAALDGLQRNCTGNCRKHSEAEVSQLNCKFPIRARHRDTGYMFQYRHWELRESTSSFLVGFMMQTNRSIQQLFFLQGAGSTEWALSPSQTS